LAKNSQHEELKQLARYYIDLFILQYAKIPNPNNQGFEEQIVMQNKRLRVYTRLLVYIFYNSKINIVELSKTPVEHKLIKFFLESLVLFIKKKDGNEASLLARVKMLTFQVYHLIEDFRHCLNIYDEKAIQDIISTSATVLNSIPTRVLIQNKNKQLFMEMYYVLSVYLFMSEDYQQSRIYLRKFSDSRQAFVEEEETREQKEEKLIQFNRIEGIEAAILESENNMEEEGEMKITRYVSNAEELSTKNKDQKEMIDDLSKSFENMTNYMNLIPFKLDELALTEKLILADNLFSEYFNSLDKTFLKTINFVQEKIDTSKIENDNSKYGEFIVTKLLVKLIEETDEKETNFSGVLEGIGEAIQIFGIPASQKFKIVFFTLCRLLDMVEAAEAQASLTKQIRDIINQFYQSLFKSSSFTDLTTLMKENEGSDRELSVIQKKKKTTLIYLKDLVIPFLMVELKFLQTKFSSEEAKIEIESTKETEDLKKMIGVVWTLIKKGGHQLVYLKDIVNKTWSNKLLTTFKAILHFILLLFKEHYAKNREENEFPHSSLTIRLDATYLFSDSPEFTFLRNNKDSFREYINFGEYESEKGVIMKFISLVGKAQKKIIKYTFEREAFMSGDNAAGLSKNEFKFQKDLMGVEIEKSKALLILQYYQKTIKKLLQCMNIATFSKVNPFEKLPKILSKSLLYEILLLCFYCLNGSSECLILLQFIEKFDDYDLTLITATISDLPHAYIDLIYFPIILEKLYERFYNDEKLVTKLIERIKSPEVYQTNFEWKYSRSANQAKINFIRSNFRYFIENKA